MTPTPTPIRGKVWKFGDGISGDDGIIQFEVVRTQANRFDADGLAEMCFRAIRPEFSEQVRPGDLVVAGRTFAVPNHPQVSMAIKACGVAAVLVESTETGFIRKSINVGLPVLVVPGITEQVDENDELEVDLEQGRVTNCSTGAVLATEPYTPTLLGIVASGGIVEFLKRTTSDAQEPRATT